MNKILFTQYENGARITRKPLHGDEYAVEYTEQELLDAAAESWAIDHDGVEPTDEQLDEALAYFVGDDDIEAL